MMIAVDLSSNFHHAIKHHQTILNHQSFHQNQTINKKQGFFSKESIDILQSLLSLKETVETVGASYSSSGNSSLLGNVKGLTDEERDAFDMKVENMLKELSGRIEKLKESVNAGPTSFSTETSFSSHKQIVVRRLLEIAQEITKVTGELQLLRLRQTMSNKSNLYNSTENDIEEMKQIERLVEEEKNKSDNRLGLRNRKQQKNIKTDFYHHHDDDQIDDYEDELDDDLRQSLEVEQIALQNHLEEELEHVKQVEKQMINFSELLSQFNTHIAQQSEAVNAIHQDVSSSTKNMDKATDQLIQAKEYSSNFRKYVVIFFGVASGLLLLLDMMD